MFKHIKIPQYELQDSYSGVGRMYGDGTFLYPSVTTIISETSDKSFLTAWRKRVGYEAAAEITRRSSEVGTAYHAICEAYLNNETEVPSDDETALGLFALSMPWLDQNVDAVLLQEACLFSHTYKYAGRVDLVAIKGGKLTIIDHKNSRQQKKTEWIQGYFDQVAGYAIAFEEMYRRRVKEATILIACWDGTLQEFTFDPAEYHDSWLERVNTFYTWNK